MYIYAMVSKMIRRKRIRDLLAHNQVGSQEQLQQMLGRSGLEVTQATLSRDLRELGVFKGPMGYVLVDQPAGPIITSMATGSRELERMLSTQLLSIQASGNLIVLKTLPGHANPLAIEIDKAGLRGVMGTIAGDDTVFVATRTAKTARVFKHLQRMAGWNRQLAHLE